MLERRIGELEFYFKRFPDVPREVIVKEDILRLGLGFSEAALEAAKGCQEKSYRLFTYDKVKYDKLEKGEPFRAPESIQVKGGPYELQRTNIGVRFNPDSPYLVDVIDGKVSLCENGTPIAEVKYPPRPRYYSKAFNDGTRYDEIVPLSCSGTMAFATVFRVCQFWGEKEECKFCDINENIRQGKKSGKLAVPKAYKPVQQVTEVMEEIFLREETPGGVRPLSYIITGGAITGKVAEKKEDDFYLEYVEAVKDRIGNRWPCVLQTIAKDKKTCKRYKSAGVDVHHANIEVWDKNLFKIICPGKDRHVGWDEWVRRLVESVDVFGEGNVTPNFVAGVEMAQPYGFKDVASAVKSTTQGLEYLMSRGVVVRFNHWNTSPLSALAGSQPPPLEYFIRIDQAWCETWTKHSLPPIGGMHTIGPGRGAFLMSGNVDMDPVRCVKGLHG